VDDVVAPSHSASDGHAPSFRDNHPSVSSPHDLIIHESGEGGRTLLKVAKCLLPSISQPSSNKLLSVFKIKRWWRAWVRTSFKTAWLNALGSSLSHPASLYVRHEICRLRQQS